MKKIAFILFVFGFCSCNLSEMNKKVMGEKVEHQEEHKGENENKKAQGNLINDPRSPNQSSQLAVLMRDMWEYADTLKTHISDSTSSKPLPEYRPQFDDVLTAIPTDENTKGASFDAMAKIMLQKLDNVYKNENTKKEHKAQVEGFNLLVKSCLQCHEQQCPGPISKISKLMIKE